MSSRLPLPALLLALAACSSSEGAAVAAGVDSVAAPAAAAASAADAAVSASAAAGAMPDAAPADAPAPGAAERAPNEMGRVMVLEYHLVGDKEARWERERGPSAATCRRSTTAATAR
jgi:hypothetical protein